MLQVKPLIWIESVIEKFSHSRVEIMVKVMYYIVCVFQKRPRNRRITVSQLYDTHTLYCATFLGKGSV